MKISLNDVNVPLRDLFFQEIHFKGGYGWMTRGRVIGDRIYFASASESAGASAIPEPREIVRWRDNQGKWQYALVIAVEELIGARMVHIDRYRISEVSDD